MFDTHLKLHQSQTKLEEYLDLYGFDTHLKLHQSQTIVILILF